MLTELDNYSYLIKILVVGDPSVGKTTFINKFINNDKELKDINDKPYDVQFKIVHINNKTVKLQVWDTLNNSNIPPNNLYSKVQGILLMFDISNFDSFFNLETWIKNINNEINKIPIIICANKYDLIDTNKCVSREQINPLCTKYNIQYCFTSGKTNFNIKKVFNQIAGECIDTVNENVTISDLSLTYSKRRCCQA